MALLAREPTQLLPLAKPIRSLSSTSFWSLICPFPKYHSLLTISFQLYTLKKRSLTDAIPCYHLQSIVPLSYLLFPIMKQQIAIAVGALAIGAHAVQGKPSRPASQRSGPDAIPAGGTKDISGGPGGHPILPRDAAPVGWEWELDESGTLVARGEDFSGGLFRREGPPGGGRGGFEGGRGGMGPPGGGRGGMEGGRGGYGGPPGRGGGDMAARGGTWM